MDPIRVVVTDVVSEKPTQMLLVENDHMIDEFAFAGANPAFSRPVLPWASVRRSLRYDAE